MSQEIAIRTDALGADTSLMQERLNAVQKEMEQMYQAVGVLNTMWEGEAHDVFLAQFASDEMAMMELCKTIQSIINCLEYAKDEYVKCENEVDSIVSSLRI